MFPMLKPHIPLGGWGAGGGAVGGLAVSLLFCPPVVFPVAFKVKAPLLLLVMPSTGNTVRPQPYPDGYDADKRGRTCRLSGGRCRESVYGKHALTKRLHQPPPSPPHLSPGADSPAGADLGRVTS